MLPSTYRSDTVIVTLGTGPGIANANNPAATLSPGDSLKLVSGLDEATITSIQWFKDGAPVGTGTPSFVIDHVTSDDSGTYSAKITTSAATGTTNEVPVRVAVPLRQQLLNLSSRATISPANPVLIGGFVVAPCPGQPKQNKFLLIRAVGGSLASLGVAHPLADVRLRIFNADGSAYGPFPLGPVSYPNQRSVPVAQTVAEVGAVPLTYHEGFNEETYVWPFPAGVYSVHVFSEHGGTGEVMLEIYEVPDSGHGNP